MREVLVFVICGEQNNVVVLGYRRRKSVESWWPISAALISHWGYFVFALDGLLVH